MNQDIAAIEAAVLRKYEICEELFRVGDMRRAVEALYTENVHYLTGDLRMLRGRDELTSFLEAIKALIAEVHVEPVLTYGDPGGVIYQFCNTSRRLASGEIARAHYIAGMRCVAGDWLIEMEVPALGWIQPITPGGALRC